MKSTRRFEFVGDIWGVDYDLVGETNPPRLTKVLLVKSGKPDLNIIDYLTDKAHQALSDEFKEEVNLYYERNAKK